jgi:hypothetical protein
MAFQNILFKKPNFTFKSCYVPNYKFLKFLLIIDEVEVQFRILAEKPRVTDQDPDLEKSFGQLRIRIHNSFKCHNYRISQIGTPSDHKCLFMIVTSCQCKELYFCFVLSKFAVMVFVCKPSIC